MYLGTYEGAMAMAGLERWQNAIAQNIANSSAAGFKQTGVSFQAEGLGGMKVSTSKDELSTHHALKVRGSINHEAGQLVPSDNPLDVAIKGKGFFSVKSPDGAAVFTRNGQFHLDSTRKLVDPAGNEVQSVSGSIVIPAGSGDLEIDTKGRIFAGSLPLGQIRIVDFEDYNQLQQVPGGFVVPEESGMRPTTAEESQVVQGFYESSNVSPMAEMVNLINVGRAYEANQKAISNFDQLMGRALQLLGK
jgi:flagellar basal body rod protein FlgG